MVKPLKKPPITYLLFLLSCPLFSLRHDSSSFSLSSLFLLSPAIFFSLYLCLSRYVTEGKAPAEATAAVHALAKRAHRCPKPRGPARWRPTGRRGVGVGTWQNFTMSERWSPAIFTGQSWCYGVRLGLRFNPIPFIFDESGWQVGTLFFANRTLNLDLSQVEPNFEVSIPNS